MLLAALAIVGVGWVLLPGSAPAPVQKPQQCLVSIKDYQHSVNWPNQAEGSIVVRARRACLPAAGMAYRLTDVAATLSFADGRVDRLWSPKGALALKLGELLMYRTYGPVKPNHRPVASTLSVELDSGTIRAPRGVFERIL